GARSRNTHAEAHSRAGGRRPGRHDAGSLHDCAARAAGHCAAHSSPAHFFERKIHRGRTHLMKFLYPLLLFIPVVFAAEFLHWNEVIVFVAAALAIVPLAGILGNATESLAHHTGPRIGGLLNAT